MFKEKWFYQECFLAHRPLSETVDGGGGEGGKEPAGEGGLESVEGVAAEGPGRPQRPHLQGHTAPLLPLQEEQARYPAVGLVILNI